MSTHVFHPNGRVRGGGGDTHLVGFISHDHLYGQRGSVFAALFEPPRDGVEGFAICHVVDWLLNTSIFSKPLSFHFCVLRTEDDALCAAIV